VEAEVIGADVRHHRDVVVADAEPAQEDAATRRLQHRDVGRLRERERGAPVP
jgi:hypothetical protein